MTKENVAKLDLSLLYEKAAAKKLQIGPDATIGCKKIALVEVAGEQISVGFNKKSVYGLIQLVQTDFQYPINTENLYTNARSIMFDYTVPFFTFDEPQPNLLNVRELLEIFDRHNWIQSY
jgi:hypothetical protein